ncbi:MAG: glycosyltransferase family 2 protein [Alphaproteobacteria bacterium]|nr:glycosyltransferase family 2 protein [Alphaproteobacteria bacterium]MCD8566591.1 glycosyltransferase family 2 protein [Alphaproteobacteria bacterium]
MDLRTLLPDYKPSASSWENLLAMLGYLGLILLLVILLPPDIFNPHSHHFLFIVGGLTIWRYLWGANHLARALIYQHIVYPGWREKAAQKNWKPSHLYIVIPSYQIPEKVTDAVFTSVIRALNVYGVPSTVIFSVANDREKDVIENLFHLLSPAKHIELLLMVQDGTGKRAAMGDALRAITRRGPPRDSIVCLMDGDSVLDSNIFTRTLYHFGVQPNLGALTTDNKPLTKGSGFVREWYYLRMAQRHLYMSSLSLSRKVLCLTGRFSCFRGDIALREDFIGRLVHDEINHWRHGSLEMLTGDDKSTWFYVLEYGYDMIYCPDACVYPIEELPSGSFIHASEQLMFRWFGNMLRNNGRALALGPKRTGLFLWRCLLDQRISIWTSLSGPVAGILGSLVVTPHFFTAYILWVMISRLWHCGIIFLMRGRFSSYFIVLIFYAQVFGALMKLYVRFRLNRQQWNRQKIQHSPVKSHDLWAVYLNTFSLFALTVFIAVMMGVFELRFSVF